MSGIAEIMKAVERLNPGDFLKLRSALDRVEETLWDRELRQVSAKPRNAKLTDARIDELVRLRRYKGRRATATASETGPAGPQTPPRRGA